MLKRKAMRINIKIFSLLPLFIFYLIYQNINSVKVVKKIL